MKPPMCLLAKRPAAQRLQSRSVPPLALDARAAAAPTAPFGCAAPAWALCDTDARRSPLGLPIEWACFLSTRRPDAPARPTVLCAAVAPEPTAAQAAFSLVPTRRCALCGVEATWGAHGHAADRTAPRGVAFWRRPPAPPRSAPPPKSPQRRASCPRKRAQSAARRRAAPRPQPRPGARQFGARRSVELRAKLAPKGSLENAASGEPERKLQARGKYRHLDLAGATCERSRRQAAPVFQTRAPFAPP